MKKNVEDFKSSKSSWPKDKELLIQIASRKHLSVRKKRKNPEEQIRQTNFRNRDPNPSCCFARNNGINEDNAAEFKKNHFSPLGQQMSSLIENFESPPFCSLLIFRKASLCVRFCSVLFCFGKT